MAGPSASTRLALPPVGWGVIAAFGAALGVGWTVTVLSAPNLNQFLMTQFQGTSPVGWTVFLGLAGVMMLAMMLPSAMPMLSVYRSVSTVDTSPAEARRRAVLFASSYFFVWALFAAVALAVLTFVGLLGTLSLPLALIPGGLLVAAGVYQFSFWKQFCLRQCRGPLEFILTRWRKGRNGAWRMGFAHATYCVGCCWLLMLVVFVTGAMSLLWMGVFAGVVLTEKVWDQGVWFSRGTGAAAVAVGAWFVGSTLGWLGGL